MADHRSLRSTSGSDVVWPMRPRGAKALRRQDIGLLAVLVFHERDERGPVRIVFDPLDRRRDVPFAPLEVDDAIRITSYNVCYTKLLREVTGGDRTTVKRKTARWR